MKSKLKCIRDSHICVKPRRKKRKCDNKMLYCSKTQSEQGIVLRCEYQSTNSDDMADHVLNCDFKARKFSRNLMQKLIRDPKLLTCCINELEKQIPQAETIVQVKDKVGLNNVSIFKIEATGKTIIKHNKRREYLTRKKADITEDLIQITWNDLSLLGFSNASFRRMQKTAKVLRNANVPVEVNMETMIRSKRRTIRDQIEIVKLKNIIIGEECFRAFCGGRIHFRPLSN